MRTTTLIPLLAAMMSACGNMQETTQVRDDVYGIYHSTPVPAATTEEAQATEDYYDPTAAQAAERNYYDMTYNDPQYYNYDRFGFGYGTGPYWGTSLSYTTGYGYSPYVNVWSDPYWYTSYGYGGGYGYGYGYGYPSYYGGCGPCYGCYEPPVMCGGCGGANTVVAHRPSMGSGSGGGGTENTGSGTTFSSNSRVRLMPTARATMEPQRYATQSRNATTTRPSSNGTSGGRSTHGTTSTKAEGRQTTGERGSGSRSSGSGTSGGSTTPGRSGGGGTTTPSTGHRPR